MLNNRLHFRNDREYRRRIGELSDGMKQSNRKDDTVRLEYELVITGGAQCQNVKSEINCYLLQYYVI